MELLRYLISIKFQLIKSNFHLFILSFILSFIHLFLNINSLSNFSMFLCLLTSYAKQSKPDLEKVLKLIKSLKGLIQWFFNKNFYLCNFAINANFTLQMENAIVRVSLEIIQLISI